MNQSNHDNYWGNTSSSSDTSNPATPQSNTTTPSYPQSSVPAQSQSSYTAVPPQTNYPATPPAGNSYTPPQQTTSYPGAPSENRYGTTQPVAGYPTTAPPSYPGQYSTGYTPPYGTTPVNPYIPTTKKKSRLSNGGLIAICIILALVFSFAGTMLANMLVPSTAGSDPIDPIVGPDQVVNDPLSDAYAELVEMTKGSVVEITTMIPASASPEGIPQQGVGSGVIVSSDGYILTNDHVIADSTPINVTLHNGLSYVARLVGTDPQTDIAVIKIEASSLSAATLGDSSTLRVGDRVIAIGNPLGTLGGTVTEGIISATDREVVVGGYTMKLLQTSAAVNPGNSGGGLFNMGGQLIGIVNSKSSGEDIEGLGFAVPINTVKQVMNRLMASES